MKRVFGIILVVVFAFVLCACSAGISGDEAKSHINGFLEKIENEDYQAAEKFLHPQRPMELQVFFETLENENNVDFSNINIEKYLGFESSWYNGSVGGSAYRLKMKIAASDRIFQMDIQIVKNDSGYGIYDIDVDFD